MANQMARVRWRHIVIIPRNKGYTTCL